MSVSKHNAIPRCPCPLERTAEENLRILVNVSWLFFLYAQLDEFMSAATTAFIVLAGFAAALTIVAAVVQRNRVS